MNNVSRGVMATAFAALLETVGASSGVIGGHHPSAHDLSFILSPHNSTIGGLDYGITEESFEGESLKKKP